MTLGANSAFKRRKLRPIFNFFIVIWNNVTAWTDEDLPVSNFYQNQVMSQIWWDDVIDGNSKKALRRHSGDVYALYNI